jgi:hypothetical protein
MLEMYQQIEPEQGIVQRALQRLKRLLQDADFEFTEFKNALLAILYGAWLLNPTWHTFASSHSYDAMAWLAPEEVWGTLICVLGLLQMLGFVGERRRMRQRASGVGVFVWASITTALWLANPASTAVPVYGLFTFSSAWSLWRLASKNG